MSLNVKDKKTVKEKHSAESKYSANVLLTGVGGQGILLASELIGLAAAAEGLDVKKSEVHGMAQRGGSVNSHIRIGEKVYSPTIPVGEADFILAFESLEALRSMNYLKKKGIAIFNSQKIIPVSSFITGTAYPQNIAEIFKSKNFKSIEVDGIKMSKDLGSLRIMNTLFVGILSYFMPFKDESWDEAIKTGIKSAFYDINKKAFLYGKNYMGDNSK
jgi:indolepyruvate ferredoxin oxidoreductase, beta subunit